MARVYPQAWFGDGLVPVAEATLSITSAAVLYGLSVYTVLPVTVSRDGTPLGFRLADHYRRLVNSARIIGIDTWEPAWSEARFEEALAAVVRANAIDGDVFVRVSVHVDEQLPGTRSRGIGTCLSMFVYGAEPILPLDGARLKTSVWRRIPDYAIPSRAKVNGAYVNSVLAKQDAIDSGYDDCIFLDASGHVCELSAANIFIVRGGVLITPSTAQDLLEGINRATVLAIADSLGVPVHEREVDLTELYIADEVFACGTSTYIAPVVEVDARVVNGASPGPVTTRLRARYQVVLRGEDDEFAHLVTPLR
ncbi:MAG TPA: aminotransferase class IV [Thermoleophilia bacterium]|nr:aminotransferase class IV [Thermoleophilia bacterium]